MCGIAGIVSLNKMPLSKASSDDLSSMLSCMIQRGPDGRGIKEFDQCVFGMQRLAIIDIAGGQQPISNEDDSVWIIMNGEIYNYVELREKLIQRGHIFKTKSDTEVVLHLYEEYSDDFVHQLNGMFAIFIYDTRKDQILLFRDRMGIKPLFYSEKNGNLYFSSDLNGLSRVLDAGFSRNSIASYLSLSYVPKPFSAYNGISKILPGQAVKIDRRRNLTFYQYWTPYQIVNEGITFSEAKTQLEQLLLDSNSIQLRTDTEFAISLSGGIDSTTVLAFASASHKKQLNTISVGYEGKNASEDSRYAKEVAQHFKTNHVDIEIKRSQFIEYLREIMPLIDEPISDSALIPTYIVAKEARKRNIKVLLSGAGGDELFGGYHRHWRPSYLSARGLVLHPEVIRKIGYSILKGLGIDNNNLRLIKTELAFASDINGLNYSFLKRTCKNEVYELQMQSVREHYASVTYNRSNYQYNKMYHDAESYLVDNILSLNDKASMAASVEGRFPLIDHRIVEFAFSLPPQINFNGSNSKGLLKEVIRKYVPETVINRKKEGFNAPISTWFGSTGSDDFHNNVLEGVEEYLSDFIDIDKLRNSLKGGSTNRKIFENVYNIFLLIEWFKSRNSNG